jgi:hypothetical protein
MRPQARLLPQAGIRVATATTTLNVEEPDKELVALVEPATSRQSEILRGSATPRRCWSRSRSWTSGGPWDLSSIDAGCAGLAASYLTYPQVGLGIVEQVSQKLPLITLIYMRPYL